MATDDIQLNCREQILISRIAENRKAGFFVGYLAAKRVCNADLLLGIGAGPGMASVKLLEKLMADAALVDNVDVKTFQLQLLPVILKWRGSIIAVL